jgi:hypothetical protein
MARQRESDGVVVGKGGWLTRPMLYLRISNVAINDQPAIPTSCGDERQTCDPGILLYRSSPCRTLRGFYSSNDRTRPISADRVYPRQHQPDDRAGSTKHYRVFSMMMTNLVPELHPALHEVLGLVVPDAVPRRAVHLLEVIDRELQEDVQAKRYQANVRCRGVQCQF